MSKRLDRLPPPKRSNRATPCKAKRQTAGTLAGVSVMLNTYPNDPRWEDQDEMMDDEPSGGPYGGPE